ncbi:MAG TPA: SusC/RagA family TonB-linked outer membrane protein [Gemmatimonadota bacterium]|nr:SusC/RagA family TonB-linked outer membrane protein [Gemmatimonadota bacterium]
MSTRSSLVGTLVALVAAVLLLAPGALDAQGTGTVSGTVRSATTAEALASAQVYIVGTQIGTLTDEGGKYTLNNVPTGDHQIRVRLIGYSVQSKSVTVTAGQSVTLNFELGQKAIELSQIVVTGTGSAGVERKRLGNTIATINTTQLEDAPTQNVSEVLAGREPGVQILPSSGLAGEGSKIRIRGTASVTQSSEPVIYIDGVRYTRSGGDFSSPFNSAGDFGVGAISPLDQIDPNTISRVEILKGAAAATLYGTEASNGVIQVFTKSGSAGAPHWNFQVDGGFEVMPTNRLTPHSNFVACPDNVAANCSDQSVLDQLAMVKKRWGVSLQPYQTFQRTILADARETGRIANVAGQVSGGSEDVTYFLAGRYHYNNGIYGFGQFPADFRGPPGARSDDRNEQVNSTLSLNFFPADALRVQTHAYYANTDQAAPQTANNIFGTWSLLVDSQPALATCPATGPCTAMTSKNYYGTPTFATVHEAAQVTDNLSVDHFGGNAQLSYQPSEAVTLNGTVGADIINNVNDNNFPFGWNVDGFNTSFFPTGLRDAFTNTVTTITGELRGTWDWQVSPELSSSFTAGGQGFFSSQTNRGGESEDFPGPGIKNISAGTTQLTFEDFQQNLNAGFFAQDQFGIHNFAYLTAGVRGDANSAFGDNFSIVWYPKVSASLVFSDLPSWDSQLLSTFRVRGALGTSGLQPGNFDKFRTFAPLPGPDGTGFEPDNIGNADLKPEKTTEIEAGFEAGLLQDRVSLDVTGWHRTVNDMLVNKQFAPSGGFLNQQAVNIGQMKSKGVDLKVNWQALQKDKISINVYANGAYLQQKITDLGGAAPQKVGGSYPRPRNFIREGSAPGAFFGAKLQNVAIPLDAGTMGVGGACTQPTQSDALAYFSQPRNPSDFEVLPINCGTADVLLSPLGKPFPNWQGSFGVDLTLLNHFQFHSQWEYKVGDFWVQDLSGQFRRSNSIIGRNTPGSNRVTAVMENPNSTAQERLDAAIEWAKNYRSLAPMSGLNAVFKANYLRWREVSLAYNVPENIAQKLHMSSLSVIGRVRNLALTVNNQYPGISPELNETGQCVASDVDCNFAIGQEGWRMPIPQRFTLAIRAGF